MIQNNFCSYEEDKEIFKDYILKSFIGKGRYGSVYLVENRARKRALKVFNQKINWEEDKKKIINDFQSPYMVDIVDYGETILGESSVLMEYMPLSLEDVLKQTTEKKETFSGHKACIYFTEILKSLQLQEMYGIIHRDIKPSNLFIVADTIKTSDYAFIISSPNNQLTDSAEDTQEAFGTPAYSPPEVFDGCYSHSADRWSAAVIFFQMLSGSLPFFGENVLNIMLSVIDSEPDYTLVDEKYHNFFKKCFKKNPRDRHIDTEDMFSEFEDLLISDNTTCKMVINPQQEILSIQSNTNPNQSESAAHNFGSSSKSTDIVNIIDINKKWSLRAEPLIVLEDESKSIFSLDENGHPVEYIQNRYECNNNETITDHATGLMWQQSGSEINFPYQSALDYIESLNKNNFGGYNDWRVPTIAELLSLLEPEKVNGYLHISSLFDGKQQWCWSSDKRTKSSGWYVFFYSGNVNWDFLDLDNYVRAVRLNQPF